MIKKQTYFYYENIMNENRDTWIYYNGELYHAGVRGMQWGKHLPGTDWWKTFPGRKRISKTDQLSNKLQNAPIGNNHKRNSTIRSLSGSTSKGLIFNKPQEKKKSPRDVYENLRPTTNDMLWSFDYGRGREVSYHIRRYFEKSFDKQYDRPRTALNGSDGINYLESYLDKEATDALRAYDYAIATGSTGKYINSLIQTAQMNIATACAKFLDSIGMDDEVYKFMKKLGIKDNEDIIGESAERFAYLMSMDGLKNKK